MKKRDQHDEDSTTRKILIGAIVTGTAIDLSAGTAYAHGNRSSHGAAASVLLGPEDYVLMRQSLLQPNAQETLDLVALSTKIRTFEETETNLESNQEYKQLLDEKGDLVRKLHSRPITEDVVQFLADGDVEAAAAAIEGTGSIEQILDSYRWVMLDIANTEADLKDYTSPPKNLDQITQIARKAAEFAEKALDDADNERYRPRSYAIMTTVAELFHNIGSFTHPDVGTDTVPEESRRLGQKCAERALTLRVQLNQPSETMRAKLLLGEVRLTQKLPLEAMKLFTEAAKEAKDLSEPDQVALGLSKASNLLVAENVDAAEAILRDATETYNALPPLQRGGLDRRLVPQLLEKTRLQIEGMK